ncbi:MAG: glutamate synthase subunit beta [Legionellaceae bacterium]|nr:glutamate synthase subunit beta [Legionellaceae bacterium]
MKETRIPLFQFIDQARKLPPKQSADERIRHFAAIYSGFAIKDAKIQSERCIDCGNPYCQWRCPVHNYIPQWLHLVAEGKIMEAAELAHQTNSLPEMCGQVCPQAALCEGACTLANAPGAVTIGAIEYYLTDKALRQGWRPDLSAVRPLPYSVAIVGAGPAGLACADRLARLGIKAQVYDRHPEIGGLLTFGIPQFKLEKHLVQRRHQILQGMGIEFHTGIEIGRDHSAADLLKSHDALFLAMGADAGILADVPGKELAGVYAALPFLIQQIKILLGYPHQQAFDFQGKTILILGAGDTAMDCARTAIRLGAKAVHCLYRRREEDLQTSEKDFQLAREEGAHFHWLQQVTAFQGEKKVQAVQVETTCIDRKGDLCFTGKTKKMAADAVIVAYGFTAPSHPWLQPLGIQTREQGLTRVNEQPYPLQTDHPRIFAGGDMVLGPNLVVNAVAQGQQAAQSIYQFLQQASTSPPLSPGKT